MSRVTPPVTKLTHAIRSMSSSANRSSITIIENSRHVSIYLPRKLSELQAECSKRQLNTKGSNLELVDRLTAHDLTSSRDFHTGGHRPTSKVKTIPLMQGFRTTAPKAAAHDKSTIDFFTFPQMPEPPAENPFAKLRVPLLPDNYHPDRSANSPHAIETLDAAVPTQEIHIIASHPENVVPAVMSEVVGNDGLDVDLGQLTAGFTGTKAEEPKEPGIFKEIWGGLVDDIFGEKSKPPKHAV